MNKILESLISQLSENEKKSLAEYIERQYAVEKEVLSEKNINLAKAMGYIKDEH